MLKLDEEKKKLDKMIEEEKPYSEIYKQSVLIDDLLIEFYKGKIKN